MLREKDYVTKTDREEKSVEITRDLLREAKAVRFTGSKTLRIHFSQGTPSQFEIETKESRPA